MPLNATQYHSIPLNTTKCHKMPQNATKCHPALPPYEPRCSLRPRPRANFHRQTRRWTRARAGLCGDACRASRCVPILGQIRNAGCWCCRHSIELLEMSRSVPVWALVLNPQPSQSLPKEVPAGLGGVP